MLENVLSKQNILLSFQANICLRTYFQTDKWPGVLYCCRRTYFQTNNCCLFMQAGVGERIFNRQLLAYIQYLCKLLPGAFSFSFSGHAQMHICTCTNAAHHSQLLKLQCKIQSLAESRIKTVFVPKAFLALKQKKRLKVRYINEVLKQFRATW